MAATEVPAQPSTDAVATGDEHRAGVAFWVTAALGAAIVTFGIKGMLDNEPRGAASAARWFLGGALLLDLVVVPLGALLGAIGKRVVPDWSWPIVRAALFTSVVLIVVSGPLVLDKGGVPANPTIRPRDYTAGLIGALLVTWAITAIALAARWARRRRP